MDAPPIQYARTDDDVNIAYWTLGEGPPLVILNTLAVSDIEYEWTVGDIQRWYVGLARHRRVVRLDYRGSGLSMWHTATAELDKYVRDVVCVIERLKVDRVSMLGCGVSAPVAVRYAALWPERLNRLVLFNPYLGGPGETVTARVNEERSLARGSRDRWARTLTKWFDPDDADAGGFLPHLFTARLPDAHQAMVQMLESLDVDLSAVHTPTLCLVRETDVDGSPRAVGPAETIPGVRVETFPGSALVPYFQGADEIREAVEAWLNGHSQADGYRNSRI